VHLDHRKLLATHEAMIWATGLDAEAGQVSLEEYRKGVSDFRARIGSTATGALSEAEWQQLIDMGARERDAVEFKWIDDTVSGLRIGLPLKIIDPHPQKTSWNGQQWDSPDGRILITTFRHPLRRQTINTQIKRTLDQRKGFIIKSFDLQADSFVLDGFASGEPRPFHLHTRGYQTGDDIVGVVVHYPPERAEIMERVVNAIGSGFQHENGWRDIFLSNCGRLPSAPKGTAARAGEAPAIVRVVFGTNRKPLSSGTTNVDRAAFDELFGTEPGGELHLGCADVSVPTDAKARRELKRPVGPPDVSKNFVIERYRYLAGSGPNDPGRKLRLIDDVYRAGHERALLFIHGYNVSFANALLRVAQIVNDSGYTGKVYMFSWPSLARSTYYPQDLDNAEQSEIYLEHFIRQVLSDRTLSKLDIVVHSMGSQPLLRVIRGVSRSFDDTTFRRRARVRLGQVIFAAPDVGVDVFREKVQEIVPFADRVTLYTSATDCAMFASRILRLGRPRAGDVHPDPLVVPDIDTIDATVQRPATSWLGRYAGVLRFDNLQSWFACNHSYFADRPALLTDIAKLLKQNLGPAQRGGGALEPVRATDGSVRYWRLKGE
jgi:esterase/lipase superfamily enzyme